MYFTPGVDACVSACVFEGDIWIFMLDLFSHGDHLP